MLNSVLLLGSTYGNKKKINYLFGLVWILYMLLNTTNQSGFVFVGINIVAFLVLFMFSKLFKNKTSNRIVSISSILIWSIIIDIICYFSFPQFVFGQSLVTYVGNGILFNYKYALMNLGIVGALSLVGLLNKIRVKNIFSVKNEI